MKKFAKTLWQVVVSMAMAFVGAIVSAHLSEYWAAPVVAFFGCSMLGALLTGVFEQDKSGARREYVNYEGRKNYGQAAVFLGTACIFMGTPQECDKVADDLWHHDQPSEVRALTGDEVFDVL